MAGWVHRTVTIYQLTGAEGPGFETYPDASFTYDSMGNRTQVVFSGQTEVYAANELNQYTSVSSVNYQYDLNGNLTDDGNQLYQYDYENRLTAVRRKSDNALIAEYRYDPFGRRAKKFVYIPEARVVNYLYDGAQVIEERNEDFEPAKRFVYGPGIDEPISIQNVISGETYFYQRDGLGSVTEITDEQGNVVERYRYSPFGKLKIYDGSWNQLTGSTVGNPYFFTGRRYDPESGLYYYRARMYSQELGRFLQPDPIGYWDNLNLYQYCRNNPAKRIDPWGLQSTPNPASTPVPPDSSNFDETGAWAMAYGHGTVTAVAVAHIMYINRDHIDRGTQAFNRFVLLRIAPPCDAFASAVGVGVNQYIAPPVNYMTSRVIAIVDSINGAIGRDNSTEDEDRDN